jgi:hypothetical protein
MPARTVVKKSYELLDPVKEYCIKHSTPLHPVQIKLLEETLKHPRVINSYRKNILKPFYKV